MTGTTHASRGLALSFLLLSFTLSFAKADAVSSVGPKDHSQPSDSVAPVDYAAYGEFQNVGTPQYRYVVRDARGLAQSVGAGIYPDTGNLSEDDEYRNLVRDHRLDGPPEKFRAEVDPVLAYYKWVSLKGFSNQGLRLYNIARSLEEMGRLWQALKAYYAVVVHFPKAVAWQDGSPWYIGVSALDDVYRLLDHHPEWKLALLHAQVRVENGYDKKATNDIFHVNPGVWADRSTVSDRRPTSDHYQTSFERGNVRFVRWSNGDWQLRVNDHPFLIRGISYFPTPIGRSPDWGYKPHLDWMTSDENRNQRIDGPYDSFVDLNGNNKQDDNEPTVGDFRLFEELGVNTVRLYHHAVNKDLLRDLDRNHGIKVLMGDLVGDYTIGSDAAWEQGTDYSDEAQRSKMKASVRKMVMDHKDESYVLMWVLGNENNYGHGNNSRKDPQTYYRFINSLARMVHRLDPSRPVALCNGDIEFLDIIARECPDVDVLAVNAYRGKNGMGESFWSGLHDLWRRPVLISEFGCPSYNGEQSAEDAEHTQAEYLVSNWRDIAAHAAGSKTGNSIGGVLFEFVDEWWKAGPQFDASIQDKTPQTKGPFHGGWIYEEWLGITSQGNGDLSPFLRRLKPAYNAFKDGPWHEPLNFRPATVADSSGATREN